MLLLQKAAVTTAVYDAGIAVPDIEKWGSAVATIDKAGVATYDAPGIAAPDVEKGSIAIAAVADAGGATDVTHSAARERRCGGE